MGELDLKIDDVEISLDEIRLALNECKIAGYTLEPVKNAMLLIQELIARTNDIALQDDLIAILEKLKEKRASKKALEDEEKKKIVEMDSVDGLLADFPRFEKDKLVVGNVYNTAVIDSQERCYDNAFVFYGAYEEELLYLMTCYAKNESASIRYVDCEKLSKKFFSKASAILAEIYRQAKLASNEIIVFHNVHCMQGCPSVEESVCYYVKEMRPLKNVRVFLACTKPSYGVEKVYKNWIENLPSMKKEIVSVFSGTLDFFYLPLPSFETVLSYVKNTFQIAELDKETEKQIKKSYYTLGYKDLSELLEKGTLENWQALATELIKRKQEAFDEFEKEFGEGIFECLSEDWDYKAKKKKVFDRPVEDAEWLNPRFVMPRNQYDTIDELDTILERLNKILNHKGYTIKQKCGWVINYALHNGDTFNNLVGLRDLPQEVSRKILQDRFGLAYDALAQLMMIERGELCFDIPDSEGQPYGLCCDGGKTVRMRKSMISAEKQEMIMEGIGTLLHELFHALQHKAETVYKEVSRGMNGEAQGNNTLQNIYDVALDKAYDGTTKLEGERLLQYYWSHFDITPYRIAEWTVNNKRYKESKKHGYENYYDQIVEADARIFSSERLAEYNSSNHPKLDA